jgi:uncharacterized OsmC-like protein
VELEDHVLVVRRIHVRYTLDLSPGADRAGIDRAHDAHARFCPVARTIGDCVDITTELEIIEREDL